MPGLDLLCNCRGYRVRKNDWGGRTQLLGGDRHVGPVNSLVTKDNWSKKDRAKQQALLQKEIDSSHKRKEKLSKIDHSSSEEDEDSHKSPWQSTMHMLGYADHHSEEDGSASEGKEPEGKSRKVRISISDQASDVSDPHEDHSEEEEENSVEKQTEEVIHLAQKISGSAAKYRENNSPKDCYVGVVADPEGTGWPWGYMGLWVSEEDFGKGEDPKQFIKFLKISKVAIAEGVEDGRGTRIKYKDGDESKELILLKATAGEAEKFSGLIKDFVNEVRELKTLLGGQPLTPSKKRGSKEERRSSKTEKEDPKKEGVQSQDEKKDEAPKDEAEGESKEEESTKSHEKKKSHHKSHHEKKEEAAEEERKEPEKAEEESTKPDEKKKSHKSHREKKVEIVEEEPKEEHKEEESKEPHEKKKSHHKSHHDKKEEAAEEEHKEEDSKESQDKKKSHHKSHHEKTDDAAKEEHEKEGSTESQDKKKSHHKSHHEKKDDEAEQDQKEEAAESNEKKKSKHKSHHEKKDDEAEQDQKEEAAESNEKKKSKHKSHHEKKDDEAEQDHKEEAADSHEKKKSKHKSHHESKDEENAEGGSVEDAVKNVKKLAHKLSGPGQIYLEDKGKTRDMYCGFVNNGDGHSSWPAGHIGIWKNEQDFKDGAKPKELAKFLKISKATYEADLQDGKATRIKYKDGDEPKDLVVLQETAKAAEHWCDGVKDFINEVRQLKKQVGA